MSLVVKKGSFGLIHPDDCINNLFDKYSNVNSDVDLKELTEEDYKKMKEEAYQKDDNKVIKINNIKDKEENAEKKNEEEETNKVVKNETKIDKNKKKNIRNKEDNQKNVVDFPAYWYKYNKDGEIVGINTGLFVDFLAEHTKAIVVDQNFYFYEDGYYKMKTDIEVKAYIRSMMESKVCTAQKINDIFQQLCIHPKLIKKQEDLNKDNYKLNLKNGIYNLRTGELSPHTPDQLITIRINANYREDLKEKDGKTFLKYLQTSIPNEKTRMVCQEVMGYCMSNFIEAKKFFVLNGKTNTGKSIFIRTTELLLDDRNISSMNWQDLKDFGVIELYNKVLNTAGDLPQKPITNDDLIKVLTGGDYVGAARKFKDYLRFINRAKFLFSTNGMPKNYGDKTDAFYERLMIIPFNNQPKEKNRELLKEIEQEIDFVFMWALEGLKRLIKNKFIFTVSDEITEEVDKYRVESNTVIQFVQDKCALNEDKMIPKGWLYETYIEYCKKELQVQHMGRNKFYEEILEKFEENVKEIRMDNARYFKGITIANG